MIQWNVSSEALMNEYVGHTLNGQPRPNLQTTDPEAEKQAARYLRENPVPRGDFWDRRWAEYKAMNPTLQDEDRPAWLKPSVTSKQREEEVRNQKCVTFTARFFAL